MLDWYSNNVKRKNGASKCCILMLRKRRVYGAIEHRRRLQAHRKGFLLKTIETAHNVRFLLSLAALTIQSPVRSVWMKPQSNSWWEDVVNAAFTSDDWLENLRMLKATFLYVCSELHLVAEKNDTLMRKAIPVEQRVALTLWFLATGTDFHTIGHLFGMSRSTVCVITKQVCNALVSILLPRIPSEDGLKKVVDGFKHKFGFPQCAGMVDGTHVLIVTLNYTYALLVHRMP